MELKDVFGEIESDGAHLVHGRLLEWALTPPLWHAEAVGGRPHHQGQKDGLLARTPVHYVTKHLQQGIESDHFRVKRPMPRVGCFQAFHTARRTIQGFEAMLWLRKGFGFAGRWTVCEQNRLLAICFGLPEVNKV